MNPGTTPPNLPKQIISTDAHAADEFGQRQRSGRRHDANAPSSVGAVNVWVEHWELQCCGDPFAVGDEVEWGLVPASPDDVLTDGLGAETAALVTHYETHHQSPDDEPQPVPTRGRVKSITAAYWRVGPRPGGSERALYPVPGTAVLEDRERADGWEPKLETLVFEGYIVELTPVP